MRQENGYLTDLKIGLMKPRSGVCPGGKLPHSKRLPFEKEKLGVGKLRDLEGIDRVG
jgi:hypothetical protein